jgi:UDP-2,3-diacylglucosamine hydrolase
MPGRAAYFLADAHLGAASLEEEAARERRLHAFFEHLPDRAATLFIVGDLFDFWFEYRTAIPRRHFRTLAALERLRDAGVEIHYLAGNHDFWLGHFFSDALGIRTHDGPLAVALQGRRVWLHHGDGLIGGDLGYKFLKGVLRNRACIALYGLLHPDLGIPLAHAVSHFSRTAREDRPPVGDRLWNEIAERRFAEGHDLVMVGHFHQTYERRERGREFFVLGDWISRFTYVVLEDGAARMERWTDEGPGGVAPAR